MSEGNPSTLKHFRAQDGNHVTYLNVHGASPGTSVTVLVPSTWASACAEAWLIGEGLHREEGMRSLKRADRLNADSAAALVHELVFEIGVHVRCVPEGEAIDALVNDLRTFLAFAVRYEQSPEGKERMLRIILDNETFPVGSLQTLDHGFAVAIEAYLLGVLLRLCSLQEQALRSGEVADARDVSACAAMAARTGHAAIDTLVMLKAAHVGPVASEREAGGCRDTGDQRECWWWRRYSYEIDGMRRYSRCWAGDGVAEDNLKTPIEIERTLEIQRISARLENELLPPVRHTVASLQRIAEMVQRERTAS
ncbi:hypothetical protein NK8_71320 (plasmid) [Caballeronia sp. NK8]|uniref:hypothetical protein n=1 Tax=Caballeronia sp. NK8 TaxID=140098 RepID=UPI001BB5D779|nr:hypothetical protein [Caballeronia sp. NK8]BCQ28942.1 hypothetical protein NK8_71320 [Caballeronia sp. NK8]